MSDSRRPEEVFSGFRDTSRNGPSRRAVPRDPSWKDSSQRSTWKGLEDRPAARRSRPETSPEDQPAEDGSIEDESTEDGSTEHGFALGGDPGDERHGGDEDPEQSVEDSEKKGAWEEVIGLYEEGNRKQARLRAARLATAERTFATPPFSEELYVLDPSIMTYGPGGEEALNSLLLRKLKAFHSRREVREITNKIRARLHERDFRKAKAIPLANGDLSVGDLSVGDPSVRPMELLGAGPDGHFLVRSNAAWDPGASCPAFKDFLRRTVPDRTDRQVLQNYTGYCLLHWDRPFRKALLLAGPEGSGRETFLRALSTAVPWTVSVAPGRLARGKAGASKLQGPWVNARTGISAEALADLRLLRSFSAGVSSHGDPSQIESAMRGGRSHRTTKHVYATGELPPLAAGDQFFRRVLLVSFPKKLSALSSRPGGTDPGLRPQLFEEKLLKERDGIFQWAAEGLGRVLQAWADGEGFPSARSAKKTRRRWESLSGPIGRFKAAPARLEVTGDPQDVVSKEQLYRTYKKFCRQEKVFAETKTEFTQTLTEDPRVKAKRRTLQSGGSQVPCYVGVKLTG
jgi:putative DNA primase/helicase